MKLYSLERIIWLKLDELSDKIKAKVFFVVVSFFVLSRKKQKKSIVISGKPKSWVISNQNSETKKKIKFYKPHCINPMVELTEIEKWREKWNEVEKCAATNFLIFFFMVRREDILSKADDSLKRSWIISLNILKTEGDINMV